MKRFYVAFAALMCIIICHAARYVYNFNHKNLAEALSYIAEQHPEIHLNFIYNEIDNYYTSASINSDNIYQILRQMIGLNPISISYKDDCYYIEALQHGKFEFCGTVIGGDKEPIAGASVLILTPRDSSVITYGVTDAMGNFVIPCDKKGVLAKFTCIGYKNKCINRPPLQMGNVTMHQLPINLAPVAVDADNTILTNDKNTYIPTSRQKNSSYDATDLLRRMAIPQLVINPGENSVKDVFGNAISVYINYHEAVEEDLKGMKMTDVRKVEFIEYPSDPRFKGEQRVVNIIVQEYEYGGYTKVSEAFTTFNGIFNNTDVFSRFTYKKMTYDVYAKSDYQAYHHAGSDNSAICRLKNDGEPVIVNRKETFNEADICSNQIPVTFRASYNTSRFTTRNTLSFTHFSSPKQQAAGDLLVNIHPENNYTYTRNNPNRNNTIYYHSNFWGLIGPNTSFDISPSFRHTHRNNISSYESTLMASPIRNHITENTYNWEVLAAGRMSCGEKNQLSFSIGGGQNIFKLNYQGSNNTHDSYSISYMAGDLRYRYQTKTITIATFVGFSFEHNLMNGITTNDAAPRAGINLRMSINRKSQLSGYLSYLTSTPDISMKANDIVQSNEYMFLSGNPNLRNWRNLTSNLAYNWYHNNSFSLAAFVGYDHDFNRVATIYRLHKNGITLIRNYINNGSYVHYYLGVSANYKMLNNGLQLYANLTQNAYNTTGIHRDSYYPFRIQLQAVYYWKSFNILASYGNPLRTMTENSNYIIRGRNFHMFSIGWGNGIWTVNIAAKNIFNKRWCSESWEMNSPLYSEYQQFYNPSAHANLNLAITYTIGYGRKVRRGDEIGPQESAPSAIIK